LISQIKIRHIIKVGVNLKNEIIMRNLTLGLLTILIISCNSSKKETTSIDTYADIKIAGVMKNVMWKGEMGNNINLDTISNKKGLYGLGPLDHLTGELLILDGRSYASKVISDSTMTVEKSFDVSAPFFVYTNVTEWTEMDLPSTIKSIKDLEQFIDKKSSEYKHPFVFKLKGEVLKAVIHIQNLPKGTKVSSPKEAHQGQVDYDLNNEESEIVGFFSTEHQGVFTHHDSFVHMHLITSDETKMGHLDELEIGNMKLYLPKK
jgi:acetolactate decarboxylase